MISLCYLPEKIKEVQAVFVIAEFPLPGIPTRGNVVDGAGLFYAERASHGDNISDDLLDCKT